MQFRCFRDFDSALGALHHVNVDIVADILDILHAVSILSVEVSRVDECSCIS